MAGTPIPAATPCDPIAYSNVATLEVEASAGSAVGDGAAMTLQPGIQPNISGVFKFVD